MALNLSALFYLFSLRGENQYIALIPLDQEDSEDGDVYLYRFREFDNGEIQLDNIIDDEEYEIVADAFDELLDSENLTRCLTTKTDS